MKANLDPKIGTPVNKEIQNKKNYSKEENTFQKVLNEKVQKTQSESSKVSKEKVTPRVNSLDLETYYLDKAQEISMIESILDKWEKYSRALASDKPLKESYFILESIREDMQKIALFKNVQKDPQLKEILDELDVLITTEEIKFNRGDYLE